MWHTAETLRCRHSRRGLAYAKGEKAFFVYGFAKNERSNITRKEIEALRLLAKTMLDLTPVQIAAAVTAGELIRIEV